MLSSVKNDRLFVALLLLAFAPLTYWNILWVLRSTGRRAGRVAAS